MSTTTTAVQDVVKLSDLKVVPEDNPRGIVTASESLTDLSSSIKRDGLLQPVLAVKQDDGTLKLTAGYRRVEASKMAGLKEIPVYVRELDDVEGAAFDENEQREEMSPMARAKSLLRQKKALGTNKKVAERRSLTSQQVGALIAMTDMPDSIQQIAMSDRNFGPTVAKEFTKVGSLPGGEAVALYIANSAVEQPKLYGKFASNPVATLSEIADYREEHAEDADRLNSLPVVCSIYGIDPKTLTTDVELLASLEERATAVKEAMGYEARTLIAPEQWRNTTTFTYTFSEIEIEAVKAAQALYEEERDEEEQRYGRASGFVFDAELILDQLDQMLTRYETQVKENEEEDRQAAIEAGEDPDAPEAEDVEPPKSNHEIAKEQAAKARTENEYIGEKLVARSSKPLSKARNLAAVKLFARMAIQSDDATAAAGNRLCFPSWKEIEIKELKSGEKREKVHYMEPRDATERLLEAIDKAKTVEQVVQITTDALITATFSNQEELPQSKRVAVGFGPRYVRTEEVKVLADLSKGVLPEAAEAALKQRMERGY